MSLNRKMILILFAAFTLMAGMALAVQWRIVYPSFAHLENEAAVQNVNRCVEDISREIEHLSILCQDWANWDESYQFMDDGNDAFVAANLVTETLATAKLNLLCFYDAAGESIWCRLFDVERQAFIDDPAFLESIRANRLLSVHETTDSERSGVILTSRGPMLVTSHPMLTSQHQGPIRGSLVMGRFLDSSQIGAMTERVRVGLQMWPLDDDLPERERAVIRKVSSTHPNGVVEVSDDVLHAYASYADLNGNPALLLRAQVPRDITDRGAAVVRSAMLAMLAGGAAVLLMIFVGCRGAVLQPLRKLTTHAIAIGRDDRVVSRLDLRRDDDIGVLARELDQLAGRLQESRAKVLESAHLAGMADLTGEALHDIGNALNTVCMSTAEIGEYLRESKVDGYRKAMATVSENQERLGEFFQENDRGQKVLSYLFKLSDLFASDQEHLSREYQMLQGKVEHIRGILQAQQASADRAGGIEAVDLTAVVDDVLKIQQRALDRAAIQVVRELDGLPVLRLNRGKLTEVLVNLVTNAVESMTARGGNALTLTLRAGIHDGRVRLEIVDTGVGIEPQQMDKLFRSGFTTKPDGDGTGLCLSARAIQLMGGTLTARSDGRNRGAAFVIEFQSRAVEVNA